MSLLDTKAQALNQARAALDLMAAHGVWPSPRNFEIWYHYCSNRCPDLVKRVDVLIHDQAEITDEICEEIYREHLSGPDNTHEIAITKAAIDAQLVRIIEHIDNARDGQSGYSERLAIFAGGVANVANNEALGIMVKDLVTDTRKIIEAGHEFETKLAGSSREIDDLRRHLEEARKDALTDGLTGLANRRSFDARLDDETNEANRTGDPLCLILADIDGFKRFNDTYGHQIGDEALRMLAKLLKNNVKGQDLAARYGGEEFAVLLPRTTLSNAIKLGETLRQRLAKCDLNNKRTGESYGRVTFSMGVAQYRSDEPPGELVCRTDEALYRSKSSGGNQVVKQGETEFA